MKKTLIVIIIMVLILTSCSTEIKKTDMKIKEFLGYVLLSRPTDIAITCTVVSDVEMTVYIEYEKDSKKTVTAIYKTNTENPTVILIEGLTANSEYTYRLYYKTANESEYYVDSDNSFVTAKDKGVGFSFAIQSDSHLKDKADREIYMNNMIEIKEKNYDFFFDLGDTFLNDNSFDITYDEVGEIYRDQLPFLSTVAENSSLFLVIGNHEGEYGYYNNGEECLPVYSAKWRTLYYKNPVFNHFYTGGEIEEEYIGNPQNYYSFTWGDALFVALDPYRYTMGEPYVKDGDPWDWTLGNEQYRWLQNTLENSDAKYKFVFSHHANGNIRGGAEIAELFEWGGKDRRGVFVFAKQRKYYEKPIQQLMSDTNVTIFFQGHDHLFAREMVDGVIYQTLPKPAEVIPDALNNFAFYPNADVLLNSGYLDVTVREDNVKVDYIRSVVAGQPDSLDIGVVYSYTIDSKGNLNIIKTTDDSIAIEEYINYH